MKAQLVNVEIKLNANTVVTKEVFPWEISILNTLHGEENVNELEEGRIQNVEGDKEEVLRLARLYGRNVLENRFGAGVRPFLRLSAQVLVRPLRKRARSLPPYLRPLLMKILRPPNKGSAYDSDDTAQRSTD